MKRRRKALLASSAVAVVAVMVIYYLIFTRAPLATSQSHPTEELPAEEAPPNLLVIPEVPLGTLAIVVSCFIALVIGQIKHKS